MGCCWFHLMHKIKLGLDWPIPSHAQNQSFVESLSKKVLMSKYWKPGSERPTPLLVDDEEGGVLFVSNPTSSSSSSQYFILISISISLYQFLLVSPLNPKWTLKLISLCKRLERLRQRLPVYKYREAILYLVENHATSIIVGETGSGKTTQIPQVCSLWHFVEYLVGIPGWMCFSLYLNGSFRNQSKRLPQSEQPARICIYLYAMRCYFCIFIGGLNFNALEQLIYCTDNSTCNLLKLKWLLLVYLCSETLLFCSILIFLFFFLIC